LLADSKYISIRARHDHPMDEVSIIACRSSYSWRLVGRLYCYWPYTHYIKERKCIVTLTKELFHALCVLYCNENVMEILKLHSKLHIILRI